MTTFSTTRIANFVVTLSAPATAACSVNYATVDGTAFGGTDYQVTTGVLNFAIGDITKTIPVPLNALSEGGLTFDMLLSSPVGCTITTGEEGIATIGVVIPPVTYLSRFEWTYNTLKLTTNGYFGPTTGGSTLAFQCPYHARENAIIVEAPDWCHESVSETISFWAKLEAWKTILDGTTTGMAACWASIEANYIPTPTVGQIWGAYTPASPAGYEPDAATIALTPVDYNTTVTVGADPLYTELVAAYTGQDVYLMHWLYDVDGAYGFHGADGTTKLMAPINNYQRGPVEDGLATITHCCYEDYKNGGQPIGASGFGFLPIYDQAPPTYSSSANPYSYSAQWTYSCAPDAESRAIGAIYAAHTLSTAAGIAPIATKSKKMADYMRYAFYDKYFVPIHNNAGTLINGAGKHYLLSWGAGFGGGIIVPPGTASYWGFRIGCSEVHFGYNCVDVAYACMTGGDFAPLGATAAADYATSLDRQLELIRWLQSPAGPIAGGVTSNWKGVYGTPTDARVSAQFYGMNYTYSPSWHNPPSNNWTGYQAWGLGKVSQLYATVCQNTDTVSLSLITRCGVILDLWVQWFYTNCVMDLVNGSMAYPINSSWTSPTVVSGHTSTVATAAGDYEYLPTLNWDSTGNYATFWSASAVPNPNLLYTTTSTGWDPGTAAGFAQVLIQYAYAKSKLTGSLTGIIPGGTATFQQVLTKAQQMMEVVWWNQDPVGFGSIGSLALPRLNDILWIPPQFGTGAMPNGEVLANGVTTFKSARMSLYSTTANWSGVQTYLAAVATAYPTISGMWVANNAPALNAALNTIAADTTLPIAPSVNYHRFWNGADVAVAFAMFQQYFPTLAVPTFTTPFSPCWVNAQINYAVFLATEYGSTTTTRTAAKAACLTALTSTLMSGAQVTAMTTAINTCVDACVAALATPATYATVSAAAIATGITAALAAM